MDYQSTYPYSNAFLQPDIQFNQATREVAKNRQEETETPPPPTPVPTLNVSQYNEQTYIENVLRLNRGKVATVYCSFSESAEWRDRTFKGVIEEVGRDHIIIGDPKTDKHYLIPMIYLDFVEFDEPIQYQYV